MLSLFFQVFGKISVAGSDITDHFPSRLCLEIHEKYFTARLHILPGAMRRTWKPLDGWVLQKIPTSLRETVKGKELQPQDTCSWWKMSIWFSGMSSGTLMGKAAPSRHLYWLYISIVPPWGNSLPSPFIFSSQLGEKNKADNLREIFWFCF